MRLNQFLAEYERELSKKRRPGSAGSSRRSLKPSRSLPGMSSLKPRGRSKSPAPVPAPDAHQKPYYAEGSPTFEQQFVEAVRQRKLKIQLEGIGNPDGRAWHNKASDRSGVKKVDDEYKKTPDQPTAIALREIQLTAQGNMQRLSAVIQLAKDIRVIESGIGSAGGHIAREMGSPGPINGHNLVRPWEKAHTDVVSNAQTHEMLVPPKEIFQPNWNRNHVTAKVLSMDTPPEKVVKDPLFLQEIQQFRHPDSVPRTATHELQGRPRSAPTTSASKKLLPRSYVDSKEKHIDELLRAGGSGSGGGRGGGVPDCIDDSVTRTDDSNLADAQHKWSEAVKQLRSTAKELVYKDLTELTALREPPESLANLVAFVCILLGLQPTWKAAKRALFKELISLQNFLTEVDPLTIPVRRLRKAVELRDGKLSFLTAENLSLYSKSLVFEKLGLWVLSFDAIARIIIAIDDGRCRKTQENGVLLRAEPDMNDYAYPIFCSNEDPNAYGLAPSAAPESPHVTDMRKNKVSNRVLHDNIKQQEDSKVPSRLVAEARKKYRNIPKASEQHITLVKPSVFDLNRPRSAGATAQSGGGGSKSRSSGRGQDNNKSLGASRGEEGETHISSSNIDILAFFQSLALDESLLGSWSLNSTSHPALNSPLNSMAQAAAAAASSSPWDTMLNSSTNTLLTPPLHVVPLLPVVVAPKPHGILRNAADTEFASPDPIPTSSQQVLDPSPLSGEGRITTAITDLRRPSAQPTSPKVTPKSTKKISFALSDSVAQQSLTGEGEEDYYGEDFD